MHHLTLTCTHFPQCAAPKLAGLTRLQHLSLGVNLNVARSNAACNALAKHITALRGLQVFQFNKWQRMDFASAAAHARLLKSLSLLPDLKNFVLSVTELELGAV